MNIAFVHINKTGGSSIEAALGLPFRHLTAIELIDEMGIASWQSRLTFTVVRNPWDRAVSHYHYRKDRGWLGADPLSFSDWIRRAYRDEDPLLYDVPKMFMPQSRWIVNGLGQVAVKRIYRFETLASDFKKIAAELDVSVTLPHLKASSRSRRSYRDYYDDPTAGFVAQRFQEDIERFGYSF